MHQRCGAISFPVPVAIIGLQTFWDWTKNTPDYQESRSKLKINLNDSFQFLFMKKRTIGIVYTIRKSGK